MRAPRGGFAATLAAHTQRAAAVDGAVPARRTALTRSEAAGALAAAWEKVTGEQPSGETVSILTAQWSHETGNGSHMYNYNFGGIKGTGPGGASVVQRTREGWGATEQTIRDRFRAYSTAEEGATDYVRLLANRYGEAVGAARDGDPARFVQELKRGGYFTGNEAAYQSSVTRLTNEIQNELGGAYPNAGPSAARPVELPPPPIPEVPLPALGPALDVRLASRGQFAEALPLDTSLAYVQAMSEMLDRTALSISAERDEEGRGVL